MKDCPIYSLLELIGKKRVMMVFRSVHAGNHTFTQIKDNIWEISANLLTERLNELIDVGYISKEVLSVQPVKIHYSLTPEGKKLGVLINNLAQFAAETSKNGKDFISKHMC